MDKQLREQRVYLKGVNDGEIVYLDAQRRLYKRSIDKFVRLEEVSERELEIPVDVGVIEFVDGQRIRGKISVGDATDEGGFYWECMIGDRWEKQAEISAFEQAVGVNQREQDVEEGYRERIAVNLDEVRRITFGGEPNEIVVGAEDVLVMKNGELIRGFVIEAKGDVFRFQMEDAEEAMDVGIGQVRAISLMNQVMEGDRGEYVVNMKDGGRFYANSLRMSDKVVGMEISLTGQGERSVEVPLEMVGEIDVLKSGFRLAYLSEMDVVVEEPSVVFGKSYRHEISQRVMKLHAPLSLRFDLPRGVVRLGGIVELDEDEDVPQLAGWADMNVVFRGNGYEKKYRLNGEARRHDIEVNLEGKREVFVELDEGLNGPVLDRMRLLDAKLLIRVRREDTTRTGMME
ncbi:hypothetical protein [Poriferisphaera corsica]|nr:hypothetical protein [Poriferisphaera corsica]